MKKICDCKREDVVNFGCRCGAIDYERASNHIGKAYAYLRKHRIQVTIVFADGEVWVPPQVKPQPVVQAPKPAQTQPVAAGGTFPKVGQVCDANVLWASGALPTWFQLCYGGYFSRCVRCALLWCTGAGYPAGHPHYTAAPHPSPCNTITPDGKYACGDATVSALPK